MCVGFQLIVVLILLSSRLTKQARKGYLLSKLYVTVLSVKMFVKGVDLVYGSKDVVNVT